MCEPFEHGFYKRNEEPGELLELQRYQELQDEVAKLRAMVTALASDLYGRRPHLEAFRYQSTMTVSPELLGREWINGETAKIGAAEGQAGNARGPAE